MLSVIAESLTGRRIAITGATGFVGTALVERLHPLGAPVRAGARDPWRPEIGRRNGAEC